MKRRLLTTSMLVLAVMLGAGCASKGGDKGGDAATGADASDGGATTAAASEGGAWTGNPVDNPDSPLYNKTIYFDFDMSELRPEFMDTLRAHAAYLSGNPDISVTVEGHCDERGSREYNIALGERRANAVKTFFQAEGVNPSQISTLSYGEERPADPGHTEASWALNRRAIVVY